MPIYMEIASKLMGDGSVRNRVAFLGDGSVFQADGSVRLALDGNLDKELSKVTKHFANQPIRSINFVAGGAEGYLIGLLLPAVQKVLPVLGPYLSPDVKIGFHGFVTGNLLQQQLVGLVPPGTHFSHVGGG